MAMHNFWEMLIRFLSGGEWTEHERGPQSERRKTALDKKRFIDVHRGFVNVRNAVSQFFSLGNDLRGNFCPRHGCFFYGRACHRVMLPPQFDLQPLRSDSTLIGALVRIPQLVPIHRYGAEPAAACLRSS